MCHPSVDARHDARCNFHVPHRHIYRCGISCTPIEKASTFKLKMQRHTKVDAEETGSTSKKPKRLAQKTSGVSGGRRGAGPIASENPHSVSRSIRPAWACRGCFSSYPRYHVEQDRGRALSGSGLLRPPPSCRATSAGARIGRRREEPTGLKLTPQGTNEMPERGSAWQALPQAS